MGAVQLGLVQKSLPEPYLGRGFPPCYFARLRFSSSFADQTQKSVHVIKEKPVLTLKSQELRVKHNRD